MAILDNFIYSRNANVIFAYIPKVACTNWKCILRYLDGHKDYLDARLAHDRNKSGLSYISKMPNGIDLLMDKNIAKLTCVRNPYSRILSAYLNKIKPFAQDNAPPDRDVYFYQVFTVIDQYRQIKHPELEYVDFSCFLEWIELSGDPLAGNEHWIPQTEILGKSEYIFDFIGRIENLHKDAQIILDWLKCDIPFPTQQAVNFPPTRASESIDTYYTQIEMEQVQRIFRDDFSFLQYAATNLP